jgi:tRNA pseudouridine55 synthase
VRSAHQAGRDRASGPRLDGILVVAKPGGPTSHDVVALVRRLSGVRRVGHGGTLDPFASGVLPVFLGHATRMVEYHLGDTKSYRATVVFGARSSTDDLDGELTPADTPPPDRDAVEAALAAFRGPISQVPPSHSAVHVAGRRAYQLARQGEHPQLAPRSVTIEALDLVEWDTADPTRPLAVLEVRCSAGTYIRSLARDLGERIGCGAYLGALTRTASGPFRLTDAQPLEVVRSELAAGRAESLLLPMDTGLTDIPTMTVSPADRVALARGQVVRVPAGATASLPAEGQRAEAGELLVRVVDADGSLLAMARVRAGRLYPDKVFVAPEPVAAASPAVPPPAAQPTTGADEA